MAIEIKTASDAVAQANLMAAHFMSGQVSPDAVVMIVDEDGNLSKITDIKIATDGKSGNQTIMIFTEEQ